MSDTRTSNSNLETTVLVGVKGGSSISGATGQKIITQLNDIMSKINASERMIPKVAAGLNIKAAKSRLQKELKELSSQLQINITASAKNKSSTNGISQLSNKASNNNNAYKLQLKAKTDFEDLKKEAKETGAEIANVNERVKNLFASRLSSTIATAGIGLLINSLKGMYENVINVDSALTRLKNVTQESDSALASYANNAVVSAKRIGVGVTDIMKSTEMYTRLGYSLNDSLVLSETTNSFANIANIGVDEATANISSILKAYKKDASDIGNIGDILVAVGQKYNVSASDLAVILKNGGNALKDAGNSFEQSVALGVAGNASVQDASKVSNALKATALRIRGTSADLNELEEMGEDISDLVNGTSKLRNRIKALSGIDIMLDSDTYKDTYEIMLEIAGVWDSLSSSSQEAILENLGGSRNISVIRSIITNVKDLEGAYSTASNSSGALQKAQETYLDSIQGKLNIMHSSFETLSDSMINSDFVKGVIDTGTTALNLITDINEELGIMPILLAAISSALLARKNMGKPDTRCVRWFNVNMPIAV